MEALFAIVVLAILAWKLSRLLVPGPPHPPASHPEAAREEHGFFCAVSRHGKLPVGEIAGFAMREDSRQRRPIALSR